MTGTFSSRVFGPVIAITLTIFAGTLFAQRSDKATVVTFKAPVEIPGSNPQVLPAGTYMFKLVDSKSSPHIVQVSNKEESKVYSTIMAIPAHRDATTRDTVITFEERGGGQPQAVQTWFYPNDTGGEEFIYSGKPLTQVAATTPPVPVVESPRPDVSVSNTEPAAPPKISQAPPAPEPVPQQEAAPPPPPPAPEPQAATPAPPSNVEQPQNPESQDQEPKTLPHTASNLSMMLLAGVLALGAGLGVRVLSRQ